MAFNKANEIMLTVDNLSKSFSNTTILKDINFSLDLGKICVITGNNGSGKTTFLKCLSGLMNYESGTINFNSDNGYLFLSDKPVSYTHLTLPTKA